MQDGTLVEDVKELAEKLNATISVHLNEEGTDPTVRETWLGWSEPEIIDKVVELNGQALNNTIKTVPTKVQQNNFKAGIEDPSAAVYANLQGKTRTEQDRMIMEACETGKITPSVAAKLSMKLNEKDQNQDKDQANEDLEHEEL